MVTQATHLPGQHILETQNQSIESIQRVAASG